MSSGVLVWMVIFGLFAALFFGIAAVVSFKGIDDVRDLLFNTNKGQENE